MDKMATGVNGSDEVIKLKCGICVRKNKAREAKQYCVECRDYYCTSCTDSHKIFPTAVGAHQFLDKSNFSTDGVQTLLSCPTERCTVHNTKLLDMYCADHHEIVCATCLALNHRTCQHVHSVPDEIDDLYKKSEADKTKEELYTAMTRMEDLKKAKTLLVEELDEYKKKAVESIKDFRKEMEAMLKSIESESIRELETEYDKIRADLEVHIEETEKYTKLLKQSSVNLSESVGNRAQAFVSLKIANRHIAKVKREAIRIEKGVGVAIVFTTDPKIKTFLQELKTFGFFSTSSKTRVYNVKNMKNVYIRQNNDDRTCNIRGSCLTTDGLLLLADEANQKLKRADLSTMKVLNHVDLEVGPIAVCQTSQHEAAICLHNKTIQFVSVGEQMFTTGKLNLDHECWGLAHKNGKLFVSDGTNSLYIHDMAGTLLNKVTVCSDNQHISVSSIYDRLYIADYNFGLITFDLHGKHESTFNDPDLVNLRGICVDTRGNMFVCGSGQSKIVQINEKPKKKMGVLRKVMNCLSTCFDPKQNKLVVTVFSNDTIEVYELE